MPLRLLSVLLCALTMICSGCAGKHPRDSRLTGIAAFVADSPHAAIDSLDAIDYAVLGTADRHFYDFLSIKARDKAFVTHTSDSLILDVIDYYHGTELYPEALYYGGRVHSDLGDYPTALSYFQSSLDIIPDSDESLRLRGNVNCQIAELLQTLRMQNQAIPYLKESIRIDSILRDSIFWVEELVGLGDISLVLSDSISASIVLHRAKELAQEISSPSLEAAASIFLATMEYDCNSVDSALQLLRLAIPNISERWQSIALSYASQIYMGAGSVDTAYIYADSLAHLPDETNRRLGYKYLLSPQMRKYVPVDSMDTYIDKFYTLEEKHLSQFDAQSAITQNAFYNYSKHVRDKAIAEQAKRTITSYLAVSIIALLILFCLVVVLKYRNSRQLIQLQSTLTNLYDVSRERDSLLSAAQEKRTKNSLDIFSNSDIEVVRAKIQCELQRLMSDGAGNARINPDIQQSDVFKNLRTLIEENRPITNRDLWCRVAEIVSNVSPDFKGKLQHLAGGSITEDEYHLALLIRAGIEPVESSILLGRVRGTISYRRKKLCRLLFGSACDIRSLDGLIRLL